MSPLLCCLLMLQSPVTAAFRGGDERVVRFEHPVLAARERAAREQRLLFLKPIYGGVDALGAKSYCEGTW